MHRKTAKSAESNAESIAEKLRKNKDVQVLGPSQGFYEKTKDGYQWQIILKSKKRSALLYALEKIEQSTVTIDIDPLSTL